MASWIYDNQSSQSERREVLRNDKDTLHSRAIADIEAASGRFAQQSKAVVSGARPAVLYPRQSANSPWSQGSVVPQEPLIDGTAESDRLGYRIDGDAEPVNVPPESISTLVGSATSTPSMDWPPTSARGRAASTGFRRRI